MSDFKKENTVREEKSVFRVGDLVAVYSGGAENIAPKRRTGRIIEGPNQEGNFAVAIHGDSNWWFHPKQIRRIKPKREPRRIWINKDRLPPIGKHTVGVIASPFSEDDLWKESEWIEFQEVLPKRKK